MPNDDPTVKTSDKKFTLSRSTPTSICLLRPANKDDVPTSNPPSPCASAWSRCHPRTNRHSAQVAGHSQRPAEEQTLHDD